ncbi:hypothetical protein [Kitasatospora sp. CMC57]|uniref:hypothetical protein n=1 Tax=Kitasatospora sp. CMC57 TaxID=3231513 RepID=UPI0038B57A41
MTPTPIFASDPLSSVACATGEILLALTVGGTTFLYLTPWTAAAVVALMTVAVMSYRQGVRASVRLGGWRGRSPLPIGESKFSRRH